MMQFLWGAATSAHQVEGGNDANDWADWECSPASGVIEPAGMACDHLHRYPQDIARLAGLGLNCYRFSIEWSRIEPQEGELQPGWLEHYRAVAQCCRDHGLIPVVTYHHFTNPRWISWESPDAPRYFARLCQKVTSTLGDLVGLAITINEPNIPALLGYEVGTFPPGRQDRAMRLRVSENFIEAHRQAVTAIRDAQPGLPVGLALAMADWQTLPGGEEEMAEMRRLREDIFLEATRGDDFVGVNTYTRHRVGPDGWAGNEPGVELTAAGYEFWPEALGSTLKRAHALTGRPVIATESGVATDDDRRRVEYIDRAVAAMRAVREEGVDVRGFIYWSALDNFEWNHGYAQRFGLIAVDRESQERSVKPSAEHFGKIARSSAEG